MAAERGYRFDRRKIGRRAGPVRLRETSGQLAYEWSHLRRKLRRRSPAALRAVSEVRVPAPHPIFRVVPGPVRAWERVKPARSYGPFGGVSNMLPRTRSKSGSKRRSKASRRSD